MKPTSKAVFQNLYVSFKSLWGSGPQPFWFTGRQISCGFFPRTAARAASYLALVAAVGRPCYKPGPAHIARNVSGAPLGVESSRIKIRHPAHYKSWLSSQLLHIFTIIVSFHVAIKNNSHKAAYTFKIRILKENNKTHQSFLSFITQLCNPLLTSETTNPWIPCFFLATRFVTPLNAAKEGRRKEESRWRDGKKTRKNL
jgi:hypothetical protein